MLVYSWLATSTGASLTVAWIGWLDGVAVGGLVHDQPLLDDRLAAARLPHSRHLLVPVVPVHLLLFLAQLMFRILRGTLFRFLNLVQSGLLPGEVAAAGVPALLVAIVGVVAIHVATWAALLVVPKVMVVPLGVACAGH